MGEQSVPPLYERRDDYHFYRELGIRLGQQEYWPETLEEMFDKFLEPAGVAYKELMALGEELETFPGEDMIPENRVAKCQSTVYVTGELKDGIMRFRGCSDAAFVRGELAILIGAMSGLPPCEVVTAKAQVAQFIDKLKGIITISLIRGEGFLGMYEKMREIACDYCQAPGVQISQ